MPAAQRTGSLAGSGGRQSRWGGAGGCQRARLPHQPACAARHMPTRRRTRARRRPAGIDLEEAKKKREDNIVQLRKDRRDENLQKKRMVGTVVAAGELDSTRPMMQQKVRSAGRAGGRTGQSARPRLLGAEQAPVQPEPSAHTAVPTWQRSTAPPNRTRPNRRRCPCACSWRACPPWCKACGRRTRRRSWRPPPSSASCCRSVCAGWGGAGGSKAAAACTEADPVRVAYYAQQRGCAGMLGAGLVAPCR